MSIDSRITRVEVLNLASLVSDNTLKQEQSELQIKSDELSDEISQLSSSMSGLSSTVIGLSSTVDEIDSVIHGTIKAGEGIRKTVDSGDLTLSVAGTLTDIAKINEDIHIFNDNIAQFNVNITSTFQRNPGETSSEFILSHEPYGNDGFGATFKVVVEPLTGGGRNSATNTLTTITLHNAGQLYQPGDELSIVGYAGSATITVTTVHTRKVDIQAPLTIEKINDHLMNSTVLDDSASQYLIKAGTKTFTVGDLLGVDASKEITAVEDIRIAKNSIKTFGFGVTSLFEVDTTVHITHGSYSGSGFGAIFKIVTNASQGSVVTLDHSGQFYQPLDYFTISDGTGSCIITIAQIDNDIVEMRKPLHVGTINDSSANTLAMNNDNSQFLIKGETKNFTPGEFVGVDNNSYLTPITQTAINTAVHGTIIAGDGIIKTTNNGSLTIANAVDIHTNGIVAFTATVTNAFTTFNTEFIVSPVLYSGSGVGALFKIIIGPSPGVPNVILHAAGEFYQPNDTFILTPSISQGGGGSFTVTINSVRDRIDVGDLDVDGTLSANNTTITGTLSMSATAIIKMNGNHLLINNVPLDSSDARHIQIGDNSAIYIQDGSNRYTVIKRDGKEMMTFRDGQAYSVEVKENTLFNKNIQVTGQFINPSDDRFKTNEIPLTNCLQTIIKLQPEFYTKTNLKDMTRNIGECPTYVDDDGVTQQDIDNWPKENYTGETSSFLESGLIAQDTYNNAPELRHLVSIGDDAVNNPENFTEDNKLIENVLDSNGIASYLGINYVGIIPYLIGAVKEMNTTITTLQTENTELKSIIAYPIG